MDLMDLDEVEREISQFRLADKTSPKDLKNDNFNDLNTIESFDNRLMIVVDTNVWITHLETLKKLINTLVLNNIFILVPKMVVREIDGIKKNLNSVGLLSKKVNDYFFESIQKEGTGIIFQMEHETFNEKKEWMEPDDLILDCILYQKKLKKNVILFSKDKNLCVKVKSNQVNFYNFDSERELCGIDLKNSQDDSRISTLMSIILQLFGDEPTSSFNGNSSGSQLNLNNSNNFNENLNMRIRNNISEKSNLKSRSNSNEKLNITKEKDGINFSRCSDGQYHSDPFFSIRLGISDVILNEEYGISFCLLSILPRIFGSGWEYSHEPRPWVPSYVN
ncbi:hypothetical protein HK099_001006 [Clydaea vesicula]|uniref:PIN domain-containing protein n=1 Tax=Clydaea vesicula TaxID=447962 RepID=A0AAD5U3T0_9FUNG|nr:hypothetical protein HK099_001006 [Clydaea vesicula]